jgi:predicted O-methyltransferase YrrM
MGMNLIRWISTKKWAEVDDYINGLFIPGDPALEHALQTSGQANLPRINVTPYQGKFLQVLAQMRGAKNILEIGTLGGYSAIWLARALPQDGRLTTLEADSRHVQIARENISFAGLDASVELHPGRAADTMRQFIAAGREPFDFIFIDADKEGYPEYFELALKLSRIGTCIVADNVIREGSVSNPSRNDPVVCAVRRFMEMLAAQPRVTATAVQTVSCKRHDGFAIALVTA